MNATTSFSPSSQTELRPSLAATLCGILAMTLLILTSGTSAWVLPFCALALLFTHLSDWRWPPNSLVPVVLRALLFVAIFLTGQFSPHQHRLDFSRYHSAILRTTRRRRTRPATLAQGARRALSGDFTAFIVRDFSRCVQCALRYRAENYSLYYPYSGVVCCGRCAIGNRFQRHCKYLQAVFAVALSHSHRIVFDSHTGRWRAFCIVWAWLIAKN